MPREGVTGLILAGGKSRRMGRDKACLPWGSVTLIEHIIATLRPVVDELIVSVRDARQLPHLSVRVVEDTVSRAHALGGLYTGLRAASYARCFVCACDAPFLKPRLIRFLIKEADGYDLVVPQTAQGLHPLHAVYAKSALPVIEAQLRRRQWRLHDVARKVRVKQIPPEVLVQYDPSGISLFNLNTPADYARAWDDAHHGRRAGSSVAYAFGHPLESERGRDVETLLVGDVGVGVFWDRGDRARGALASLPPAAHRHRADRSASRDERPGRDRLPGGLRGIAVAGGLPGTGQTSRMIPHLSPYSRIEDHE